jgi:hypothetical protein
MHHWSMIRAQRRTRFVRRLAAVGVTAALLSCIGWLSVLTALVALWSEVVSGTIPPGTEYVLTAVAMVTAIAHLAAWSIALCLLTEDRRLDERRRRVWWLLLILGNILTTHVYLVRWARKQPLLESGSPRG